MGSITLPSQVCELGRLQSSTRIPAGAELDHLSRAGCLGVDVGAPLLLFLRAELCRPHSTISGWEDRSRDREGYTGQQGFKLSAVWEAQDPFEDLKIAAQAGCPLPGYLGGQEGVQNLQDGVGSFPRESSLPDRAADAEDLPWAGAPILRFITGLGFLSCSASNLVLVLPLLWALVSHLWALLRSF